MLRLDFLSFGCVEVGDAAGVAGERPGHGQVGERGLNSQLKYLIEVIFLEDGAGARSNGGVITIIFFLLAFSSSLPG